MISVTDCNKEFCGLRSADINGAIAAVPDCYWGSVKRLPNYGSGRTTLNYPAPEDRIDTVHAFIGKLC